jgi:hypothetical protein
MPRKKDENKFSDIKKWQRKKKVECILQCLIEGKSSFFVMNIH